MDRDVVDSRGVERQRRPGGGEEVSGSGSARVGEEDRAGRSDEAGEEPEGEGDVRLEVEDVGGEDEVERPALDEGIALGRPVDDGDVAEEPVERERVRGEGDGFGGAVGGQDRRTGPRGGEAGQAEAAADLEDGAAAPRRRGGDDGRERDAGRPGPGPVGDRLPRASLLVAELLPVARTQDDQLVDAVGAQVEQRRDRVPPAQRGELLAQRDPEGV
jgi:hypothetical protein